MMSLLIILILAAFGIGLIVLSLSLERESGTLGERIRKLEEQAEIDRKRAAIIAQPRTDDETNDRLNDGTF